MREELLGFLVDQGVELRGDPPDTVPLFESGLLDSLALFNLVLWIEERIGAPVDPTAFEIAREWACVRNILAFVDAHIRARA
ncbi:MAG TPA: acyl carrier protein [Myxococcota bacterium]|nr:acyl carrier protein [Myxococcota bacterium]